MGMTRDWKHKDFKCADGKVYGFKSLGILIITDIQDWLFDDGKRNKLLRAAAALAIHRQNAVTIIIESTAKDLDFLGLSKDQIVPDIVMGFNAEGVVDIPMWFGE
jgi:hypothetical protein